MDFQTIIFNNLKKMFTEGDPDPLPPPPAANKFSKGKAALYGTAALGTTALGLGAYKGVQAGVNKIQTAPNIPNPLYNQNLVPKNNMSSGSNLASAAVDGQTASEKIANASGAMSQQASHVGDAAKSAIGHAADFATANPGTALAAGAVGTAAWLARRRALKNVSRGI